MDVFHLPSIEVIGFTISSILKILQCRNIVVPGADEKGAALINRSACEALSSRSSSTVRRTVKGRRHMRSNLHPGVGRLDCGQLFRLSTSISETVAQEPTPSNDEPPLEEERHESKPFPRVGDVVRYQGKWPDDINLGEVRNILLSVDNS